MFAALASAPALARYVPDATGATSGVFDVGLRGDAAIGPGALYRSVGGDGFVTIGRLGDVVAVCAFTRSGLLQTTFGSNGCTRATLAATDVPYQLLVGNTGYWVLLADTGNGRRFTLIRLTGDGQPDAAYSPSGRRTFELSCDGTDTAPRCPEVGGTGAQQLLSDKAFIAETSDSNLWLLGTRKRADDGNEDIVFRLDQGRTIASRANMANQVSSTSIYTSLGIVAHGNGILAELRTSSGYILVRVDANGAIDRAFGDQGVVKTYSDSSVDPATFYPLPIIAEDNTFLWGIAGFAPKSRARFDARGVLLGSLTVGNTGLGVPIPSVPATFTNTAVPLWVSETAQFGRWLGNETGGQWDPSAFGGQGRYQPSPVQTLFALTRDGFTLATTNSPIRHGGSSTDARLTIVDTRSAPQPIAAAAVVQPNVVLGAPSLRSEVDPSILSRWASQADGTLAWQRVTIDPAATTPIATTGTVAAVAVGKTSTLFVSDVSAAGMRWAIRTQMLDPFTPIAFYADLIGGSTVTTPHRVDISAITAEMPSFTPTAPFSNPSFLDVRIEADGSATALIWYARGKSSGFRYHIAMVRWGPAVSAAGDYVAKFVWTSELSSDFLITVQRDARERLLVIGATDRSILRLDAQGARDPTFGQAGRLDLLSLGFETSDFPAGRINMAVKPLGDGGAWIASIKRLIRIDSNGHAITTVMLSPQAPSASGSSAVFSFNDIVIESDGAVLVVYSNANHLRLLRYTAAGNLDVQYGLRGAELLTVGTSTDLSQGPVLLPMANRVLALVVNDAVTTLRYDPAIPGPSGTTVPVIEFYNTTLDHYFMSADAVEIAGIESGAAGPGWQRTGQTISAYANLVEAPGDALDVCRFYGSAVPLARSPNGRTGPNSHFYTVAGAECDSINAKDKAWQYEGPRLALTQLAASGTCPAGQQPVFRAYNNGFEASGSTWTKNDSNHRYSTSRAIIAEMVGKGWHDEGAVFCVPN